MSLASRLKTYGKKITVSRNAVFSYSVVKQRAYLNHFSEPKDAVERSYFQYRCQMKLLGFWRALLLNISSPFILLFLLLRDIKTNEVKTVDSCDALFVSLGIPQTVIPQSLNEEFSHIAVVSHADAHHLNAADKTFLRSVWKRYPLSFQFILKIYLKVSMYSAWNAQYSPKAFIVCSEYSFTSSVMTEYCRQNGIEHIDVMHGEKVFYIRDSFFQFDRCYVWDTFYRSLFERLRAPEQQFIVELPPSLRFSLPNTEKEVDFTFYLGNEGEMALRAIADHCQRLINQGYRTAVRPHPRYTDASLLCLFSSAVAIEDCSSLPIERSVLRTRHVVSLYSTVLNQALSNGVAIVIDDLTNPQKYNVLQEVEFICLNKPHRLLSELLKEEHVC